MLTEQLQKDLYSKYSFQTNMEIKTEYLAGFFDGEGWCGCYRYQNKKRGHSWKSVMAGIGNTNLKILKIFQKRFGGSLRQKDLYNYGRKPYFEWVIRCKQARIFLEAVMPFIIEKKKKAKEVLKDWEKNKSQFEWLDGRKVKRRIKKTKGLYTI